MNEKKKKRVSIQEIYFQNFVNIVLAIISIIQGLAFNDLAQRFSPIFTYAVAQGDYKPLAHFVLCFVLLLRVFQTYVIAALDYNKWELKFSDMFLIFIVGLFEYLVFSSLGAANPNGSYNFDVIVFHQRFLIISSLALIGYLRALIVIYRNRFGTETVPKEHFRMEMRLQLTNLIGVVSLQLISIYIVAAPPLTNASYISLALAAALILVLNIAYSIRTTFRKNVEIKDSKLSESELEKILPLPDTETGIIVRPAEKRDVDTLVELMTENFLYVYENLFDTSRRLTKKIMRSILTAFWGKHEFGYRKFSVAFDPKTGETVGILRTKTPDSGINPGHFFSIFILAIVILRYTGINGLLRTIKNSKEIQEASYPVFMSNELHILYLAVDRDYRRQSVGTELIKAAFEEAKVKEKEYIALEVREYNRTAIDFFEKCGFMADGGAKKDKNNVFGKGGRVRMKRKVKSEVSHSALEQIVIAKP